MMNWLAAAVDDTEVDWPAASVLEQLCKVLTGYLLLYEKIQSKMKREISSHSRAHHKHTWRWRTKKQNKQGNKLDTFLFEKWIWAGNAIMETYTLYIYLSIRAISPVVFSSRARNNKLKQASVLQLHSPQPRFRFDRTYTHTHQYGKRENDLSIPLTESVCEHARAPWFFLPAPSEIIRMIKLRLACHARSASTAAVRLFIPFCCLKYW